MARQNLPKIYLKRTCPFCLKLRIFLTEAVNGDQFEYVVFDDGDDVHKAMRARMEGSGQKPSFPAAGLTEGTLETGSDELIARFSDQANVDPASLPLLTYYDEGVFRQHIAIFKELHALKTAQATASTYGASITAAH